MINREKVIKGLEICSEHGSWHGLDCEHNGAYKDCPYRGCETGCVVTIAKDAIAMLKEQEAKPMTEYDDGWDCPRCGLKLVGKTASGYPCDEFDLPYDEIVKYCPVCGQAVKWE